MRTPLLLGIVAMFCCFLMNGLQAQDPGALTADTARVADSNYGKEFFGGFGGALVCTGGMVASAVLAGASYGGALSKSLGPTGFVMGMAGIAGFLVAVPFMVAFGVDQVRVMNGERSNYGLGLAGSLATSALCIGLNMLTFAKIPQLSFITLGTSVFLLIPAGTALTYQFFGHPKRTAGLSGSLLNLNKGKFSLGTPVPLVYPSLVMQNRMVTQVSLLSITF